MNVKNPNQHNNGNIPPFLKFLCNHGKSDLITYNQFVNLHNAYSNKIGEKNINVNIKKVFLHYLILFGKNYNISKTKILNFNYNSHKAIVKQLNIIKYGKPASLPSVVKPSYASCSCPPDFSQSGEPCACSSFGCYGWCSGDTCSDSELPWWC